MRPRAWLWAALVVGMIAVLAFDYVSRRAASRTDAESTQADLSSHPSAPRGPRVADSALRGRILGPDDKGVTAARVCANEALVSPPRLTCTNTDRDGHYTLGELPAGFYAVSAEASGFVAGSAHAGQSIALREHQTLSDIDITLSAGGVSLTGTVVDGFGGEVPFAAVVLSQALPTRVHAFTADAHGHFACAVPEGQYEVAARAEGYSQLTTRTVVPRADLTLTLLPAASIAGHVQTANGAPVAGMSVHAIQPNGFRQSTQSDAEGRYVLDGLPPGIYQLGAEGARHFGEVPGTLSLDLAQTLTEVDIVVAPATVLLGEVRIRGSGEPCAAGGVGLLGEPDPDMPAPEPEAVSGGKDLSSSVATHGAAIDGEGRVELLGVQPGRYYASVRCLDHVLVGGPRVVDVGADLKARTPLRWEVAPGTEARIHVVDADDRSVPDSGLWLLAPRPGAASAERNAILLGTDATGTARASALLPGRYLVTSSEPLLAEPVEFSVGPDERKVEVVLRYRGKSALVVTARAAHGQPVDDLEVSALALELEGKPVQANPQFAIPLGQGRYRIAPLVAGRYRVRADDGVNVPVEPAGGLVEVRASAATDIEILVGHASAIVQGQVLGVDGEPIKDAWVSAVAEGATAALTTASVQAGRGRAFSDDQGRFTLSGLRSDGVYTVTAQHHGDSDAVQPMVRPGTTLALRLGPTGHISGVVVDETGTPSNVIQVGASAKDGSSPRLARLSANVGQFAIDDVAAGEVNLFAIAQGGSATEQLVLHEGEHLAAKLVLKRSVSPGAAPPELGH